VGGFIETNNESTNDTIIVALNRSQIEEITYSLAKTLLKQSIHQKKLHPSLTLKLF